MAAVVCLQKQCLKTYNTNSSASYQCLLENMYIFFGSKTPMHHTTEQYFAISPLFAYPDLCHSTKVIHVFCDLLAVALQLVPNLHGNNSINVHFPSE